jgi:polyphosphate kinase
VAQENTARDETVDQGSPERFINRELSWLAFNERVLAEADNSRQPLLERLRFLSISANNLDEFYMVRVAGLKGQVLAGIGSASEDGLTAAQQLDAIGKRAGKLMRDQAESLKQLRVELAEAGLSVVEPDELSSEDHAFVTERFWADIFPVLTPLAVDPAHPFPFIANWGLGLALQLARGSDGNRMEGLLLLPASLARFVRLPGKTVRFMRLEDVIGLFLDHLFPGFSVIGKGMFRILRDSDGELGEDAEELVRL